jgi:transposase
MTLNRPGMHSSISETSSASDRPRGLAGPGLLAHVLVGKYADHLPLYRQSEIDAREGVDLDRATLAGLGGRRDATPGTVSRCDAAIRVGGHEVS